MGIPLPHHILYIQVSSQLSMQEFRIIAKTLHNLEDVLAEEIKDLGGASDIEIGRRMVSFVGNKELLYKANLRLRTALRVLKPIHTFRASDPEELYRELVRFRWDTVMTSKQTFAIDTTVYSDHFTHSRYVSYRAKDAIVDFFRERTGERPSVRQDNPDIYINIHIAHSEVTLSLDSSGESLHKRGYREVQTDAPINEVLAAGILLRAGWRGETDLIDPMCGSGTFLIEAALIARNIAPGIYRQGFAFERWLDYDAKLFEQLYNDDSQERAFEHMIYGSDILPNAIKVAERNVARAGLTRSISLQVCSFEDRPAVESPALVVMNPPYGERLKLSSPERLYEMIGERLKHRYAGCTAWIIAYKVEHFHSIGLKHSLRMDLMNGSLECELRSYQLFSGKHSSFVKAGEQSGPTHGDRKSLRGEKREQTMRRTDRGKRPAPDGTHPRRREEPSSASRRFSDERRRTGSSSESGENRERRPAKRFEGGKMKEQRFPARESQRTQRRYIDKNGAERTRTTSKRNYQVYRRSEED